MAAASVTNTVLTRNTAAAYPAMATIDATDGAFVTPGADQRTLIVMTTTDAGTLTVNKGDGIQADADLAVVFSAAGTKAICVESGKYLITSGDNKGKIKITGTGTVGCVVMP